MDKQIVNADSAKLSTDYPFRDILHINKGWQLVHWHDADFKRSRFDLVQRDRKEDRTKLVTWTVRASFRYYEEFFKYVSGIDFDNY